MWQQQKFEISLSFRVIVHSDEIVDEKAFKEMFWNRLRTSDGVGYSWLGRSVSVLVNNQIDQIVLDMTKDENSKTFCFLKDEK